MAGAGRRREAGGKTGAETGGKGGERCRKKGNKKDVKTVLGAGKAAETTQMRGEDNHRSWHKSKSSGRNSTNERRKQSHSSHKSKNSGRNGHK